MRAILHDGPEDERERRIEEGYALALVPLAKEIMDYVEAKLPPDTDFGVFILAKPPEGEYEGRFMAMCTDREKVARAAAEWVVSVMREEETKDTSNQPPRTQDDGEDERRDRPAGH